MAFSGGINIKVGKDFLIVHLVSLCMSIIAINAVIGKSITILSKGFTFLCLLVGFLVSWFITDKFLASIIKFLVTFFSVAIGVYILWNLLVVHNASIELLITAPILVLISHSFSLYYKYDYGINWTLNILLIVASGMLSLQNASLYIISLLGFLFLLFFALSLSTGFTPLDSKHLTGFIDKKDKYKNYFLSTFNYIDKFIWHFKLTSVFFIVILFLSILVHYYLPKLNIDLGTVLGKPKMDKFWDMTSELGEHIKGLSSEEKLLKEKEFLERKLAEFREKQKSIKNLIKIGGEKSKIPFLRGEKKRKLITGETISREKYDLELMDVKTEKAMKPQQEKQPTQKKPDKTKPTNKLIRNQQVKKYTKWLFLIILSFALLWLISGYIIKKINIYRLKTIAKKSPRTFTIKLYKLICNMLTRYGCVRKNYITASEYLSELEKNKLDFLYEKMEKFNERFQEARYSLHPLSIDDSRWNYTLYESLVGEVVKNSKFWQNLLVNYKYTFGRLNI